MHQGQQSLVRSMTFQHAKVRKPLVAVPGITDENNIVLFDKKGSFIALAECVEVAEIRRLISQVKTKTELYENRGARTSIRSYLDVTLADDEGKAFGSLLRFAMLGAVTITVGPWAMWLVFQWGRN